MIDAAIRARIRENHDSVLSVEAGAGTGKTSLLTEKYIDLLRKKKARPHEIVAVTFTEKAASELRDRIRRELESKGEREWVDDLDRAPITTIHSFAASLLRERPLEAGIEPNFEQLDAVGATLFLRKKYEDWLPEALEKDRTPLTRAMSVGFSLDMIRNIAMELYDHRDLLTALPSPRPVEGNWESFENEMIDLYQFAEKHCVQTEDEGFKSILRLSNELELVRNSPPAISERAILTRFEVKAGKGAQKNWDSPDHAKEFKTRMAELKAKLEPFIKSHREALFFDLLTWASTFVTYVEEAKRREGKLDFDDLLLLSRKLLASNEEVCRYFQKRFHYILVDEFQDTDPIQAELMWRISAQETGASWRELKLKPGKLVLVGDPKQSIYRFRRAEIDLYRATTDQLTRQGERVIISQNFRSSEPLIGWINTLFSSLLGDSYKPLAANTDHPVGQRKPILFIESPEVPKKLDAGETRRLESEAIASILRELLSSKNYFITDRKNKELRPIRPGDIAILFPVTTGVDIYEEALRDYSIPFSLEGGHLFFQRQEVHGFLATLEAIDRPTDPVAVVAALHSIFFGLSDQDLLTLHSMEPAFDYRKITTRNLAPHIGAAISLLQKFHDLAPTLLPSKLIFDLMEESALIPITLARKHGEQATANIEKLYSMARALEQAGESSLGMFVRWARERAREGDEQSESPLSTPEENDRVRLLTIHKSKGLEFPVVVWANFGGTRDRSENVIADRLNASLEFRRKASGVYFQTKTFEEAAEREKARRDEERKRLLYVAGTRARDLLIIPKFIGDHQSAALWKILDPHWEMAKEQIEIRSFDSLTLIDRKKKKDETSKPSISLHQWEKEALSPLADRSARLIPGLSLRTATELVHESKSFSFGGSGPLFGSLFHRAMELSDFNPIHVKKYAAAAIREMGGEEFLEDLEKMLDETLKNSLIDRVRKSKRYFRELPFSFKENNYLYEGSIDLLFEEPEGLVLVDYKTDRIKKEDLPSRAEHYAPQIQLYARAIISISKLPLKESILFFPRLGEATSIKIQDR